MSLGSEKDKVLLHYCSEVFIICNAITISSADYIFK